MSDDYQKQAKTFLWQHCIMPSDDDDKRVTLGNLESLLRMAAAKARDEERLECFRLADNEAGYSDIAFHIAVKIRARGDVDGMLPKEPK